VRTRFHALPAALGILASFGALADKGSGGGIANGLGNGRGGSRFADAPGQGPANAFDQRTQLFKAGGLEFKAAGGAPAPSSRGDSTASSASDRPSDSRQKPASDAAVLAQGAARGTSAKLIVAEEDMTAFFAPWKVSDREGKPVEKKPAPECGAK
jgi:hypothetical protein